jgi:hypothetical protein
MLCKEELLGVTAEPLRVPEPVSLTDIHQSNGQDDRFVGCLSGPSKRINSWSSTSESVNPTRMVDIIRH